MNIEKEQKQKELRKGDILWLAKKNMAGKKLRVRFTVLAMIFGIGFIIFLFSIGYGLQRLVVSQIASLESLRTADITSENLRDKKIGESDIKSFLKIKKVKRTEPLIALIGRGEFKDSSFDVGVFGATTDYLILSDIDPLYGEFYNSNDIESFDDFSEKEPEVLVSDENEIIFNIEEGEWIKIRETPSLKAKIIGYSKKQDNWIVGKKSKGENYLVRIDEYAKASITQERSDEWLSAKIPIWSKTAAGSFAPIMEGGKQKEEVGYFGENFINFYSERAEAKDETIAKRMVLAGDISEKGIVKLVVVNEAVVNAMGLESAKEVIGQLINVNIAFAGKDMESSIEETRMEKLEIIGIISGADSPQVFMPIVNLKTLGIDDFSQVKIEAEKQADLPKIREEIEGMGFQTASVADTVDRVLQVFRWINIGLLVLGSVALIIATLGMFNTLTVSLLERTREIGIMKAIGMKKAEVMLLFFFEAGLMGFWGGTIGFLSGFLFAKMLNLFLNLFLISPAKGFVSVVSVPWYLPFLVVAFTIFISLLTALLPAKRAAKISPLDAIRYE